MTLETDAPVSRLSAFTASFLALLAVVLGFVSLYACAGLYAWITGLSFDAASAQTRQMPLLSALCQVLSMGFTVWLGLRVGGEPGHLEQALALRPVRPSALLAFFVAGLCLQFPLSELANLLQDGLLGPRSLQEQRAMLQLLNPPSGLARLVVWLSLGVMVPVIEELLFRGVLLTGLCETQQRAGAVLISAALFGLCHVDALAVLYAFVAGVVLGVLRLRAGSIAASIAVHAGVNTLPVVLGAGALPVPGFNLPSESVQHLPAPLWLGGLVAGSALAFVAVRLQRVHSPA